MNNKHTYLSQTSLRFTRWSRAGYAVFKSLSSAVTIGFLSVSISDSSLKESIKSISNLIFNNDTQEDDISEEEVNQAKISELNLLINNISSNNLDCSAHSNLLYLSVLRLK